MQLVTENIRLKSWDEFYIKYARFLIGWDQSTITEVGSVLDSGLVTKGRRYRGGTDGLHDSPLEGDGFEPSVPLGREVLEGSNKTVSTSGSFFTGTGAQFLPARARGGGTAEKAATMGGFGSGGVPGGAPWNASAGLMGTRCTGRAAFGPVGTVVGSRHATAGWPPRSICALSPAASISRTGCELPVANGRTRIRPSQSLASHAGSGGIGPISSALARTAPPVGGASSSIRYAALFPLPPLLSALESHWCD